MAKRRLPSFPKKSARDKAIDQALLAAAKQIGAYDGGTIIIRPIGRGEALTTNPAKSAKAKPAPDVAKPNTAMALALAKARHTPAPSAVPPKGQKPPAKPEQSAAAPAPAKQKPPLTKPSQSKAKQPKAAKDAKKPKKPKRETLFQLKSRDAAEQASRGQLRQQEKAFAEKARAASLQQRNREAARAIANISQASPDDLLDLWRENIIRLDNPKSAFRALARDYIDAVESEWTRRSIIARLDPDFFKWPSTKAAPGNGTFAVLDHAEGILGYLGYHVGKTGEASSTSRQTLLKRAFEGPLPPINGPDYMREWDKAGSAIRLKKMAVSIASAVRSAKRRRNADLGIAIEHWEEDLKFLHRAYYIGRFGFDWPGST